MSCKVLQLTCNRCFKAFYGEEDSLCHMMISHRNNEHTGKNLNVRFLRFQSHDYIAEDSQVGGRDTPQSMVPSTVITILNKVDKYFETVTNEMAEMKQNILANRTEISKLYPMTTSPQDSFKAESQILNAAKEHYNASVGIQSNESAQESMGYTDEFGNDVFLNIQLHREVKHLNNKFAEHQNTCNEQLKEIKSLLLANSQSSLSQNKTNNSIKHKVSLKIKKVEDKLRMSTQQLEKEKLRSKQLLGINWQLKAQIKSIRSKVRQQNASKAGNLDKQLNILKSKCDRLAEENVSVSELAQKDRDTTAEHIACKDALMEENKALQKALTCSEEKLKDVEWQLERAHKEINNWKKHSEEESTTVQLLKDQLNLIVKEKEESDQKMKDLLDEIEISRGIVMKKDILEDELQEQQDSCRQLQETVDKVRKDQDLKDAELSSLENELKELRSERENLKGKLKLTTEWNESRTKECSTLHGELHRYKELENTLNCAVNEADKCKSNPEAQNITLQQELGHMKTRNAKLQQDLTATEEQKLLLEAENSSFQTNIAHITNECDEIKIRLRQSEAEKIKLEQDLVVKDQELKENESELREKISALFELDAKRSHLDDENERLEESNTQMNEEISSYKELLADYDDMMHKQRLRISEINNYKEEVKRLKQSEKENTEHLIVLIREGKNLGEEIGRLEQEKVDLENELDICRNEKINECKKEANKCSEVDTFQEKLENIVKDLQSYVGETANINDLDPDQIIFKVQKEIQSKNSQIKELGSFIAEMKEKAVKLTAEVKLSHCREEEERNARKLCDAKISQLQIDVYKLQKLHGYANSTNISDGECQGKTIAPETKIIVLKTIPSEATSTGGSKLEDKEKLKKIESQRGLASNSSSNDNAPEDIVVEDCDQFDIEEPVINLVISDDELFRRRPQQIDPEELEGDFYGGGDSDSENENQFMGYLPSRACGKTQVLLPPPRLDPLISKQDSLPSVEKTSLLGPLPSLPKPGEMLKPLKAVKKKAKKKSNKEANKTNTTEEKKSKKNLLLKLDDDDDSVEFTNDNITDLFDNLL